MARWQFAFGAWAISDLSPSPWARITRAGCPWIYAAPPCRCGMRSSGACAAPRLSACSLLWPDVLSAHCGQSARLSRKQCQKFQIDPHRDIHRPHSTVLYREQRRRQCADGPDAHFPNTSGSALTAHTPDITAFPSSISDRATSTGTALLRHRTAQLRHG